MNVIDLINKTKNSAPLTDSEIKWLVNEYTEGSVPDYQMSAWLMAVCLNGLTEQETLSLTYAMRDSGETLQLDLPLTADKHSTGGVGDKTSLIIGPAAAACGVCVAKMSGRGLGHTGGTIDKLESIKGFFNVFSFLFYKRMPRGSHKAYNLLVVCVVAEIFDEILVVIFTSVEYRSARNVTIASLHKRNCYLHKMNEEWVFLNVFKASVFIDTLVVIYFIFTS